MLIGLNDGESMDEVYAGAHGEQWGGVGRCLAVLLEAAVWPIVTSTFYNQRDSTRGGGRGRENRRRGLR